MLKICIQCLENPSRVRSETIGMRFLKAITILVVVVFVPGAMGAAVDFKNNSDPKTVVILDAEGDIGSNWKIIRPWFEYVESPEILEDIAKDPAYGSVSFSDWADLVPVSEGIWAFLHQDMPPEFGLDGPYFSYNQFSAAFRTLHITLYMHGLCNVTILTGSTVLNVIPNRCGENCGNDFRTISVNLDRDEGVNEFNVSLATSPGAFILVDIIDATDVEEIIPTTTETAKSTGTDITSPSDSTIPASLETSSATSIETSRDTDCTEVFHGPEINDANYDVNYNAITLELDDVNHTIGWAIEAAWFEPVDTTDQIQEVIDNNPWYSDITFEEWNDLSPEPMGLWCLFHQDKSPEFGIGPPYMGNEKGNVILNYHNLFITYFMSGSTSMHIFAEDVLVKSITNTCGTSCSLNFVTAKVPLNTEPYRPGKSSFHIVFNTTKPGDFLIIDKIQVDDVQRTSPACTTPMSPTVSIGSSTEGPTSEYPSSIITSARTVVTSDSSPESTETSPSDLTTESDSEPTSKTNPSTSRSSDETAPSQNPTSETSGSDPTSDPSTGPETPHTTVLPETPSTTENHSSSLLPNSVLMLLIPITLQGFIISKFQ
ncbi:unnamed protein product [Allacma fusca]|uniref:Uncharacterized protein n=1 Tax=Allacma fusca TaxID=39272 RepID=A0A8J2LE24_9HEXA|nr:unnamed protein product [Allacma fusca]